VAQVSALRRVSSPDVARVHAVLERARRPVTRPELVHLTGLTDREVRECVSRLVAAGSPVITDRESGGYLWTLEPAKLKVEIARLLSHSARIRERATSLERHLAAEQAELFAETA
jgi:hypothetical protein